MGRTEDIDSSMWATNDEFMDLSPNAKLLYLWSFTNPDCNMAGLYRVSERTMRQQTGLSASQLERALVELAERAFVVYDRPILWVRSRAKHLRTKGDKMATSVARAVGELPFDHPLRIAFLRQYVDAPWLRNALSRVVENTPLVEPKTDGFSEPIDRFQGQGQGQGHIRSNGGLDVDREFLDWLTDHEKLTGHIPPREGTKARAALASSYQARRAEPYSADELKLATRGAHADDYRRQQGYDVAESVLRPTKIHNLIERGRRAGATDDRSFVDRLNRKRGG